MSVRMHTPDTQEKMHSLRVDAAPSQSMQSFMPQGTDMLIICKKRKTTLIIAYLFDELWVHAIIKFDKKLN